MTTARVAGEFIEAAGLPTTAVREAGEFIEVAGTPTTAARVAGELIEIAVSMSSPLPLRLRQRGDDLKAPRLPQFHDSRQRSPRLRTYQ